MTNDWDADRFRKALSGTKDCAAQDLPKILGILPNYADNVPKLQFPMPSPHRSQPHPIGIEFDRALDPLSVSKDTVFIKRVSENTPLEADVKLHDDRTIVIQLRERDCPNVKTANTSELVDIIVSHGLRMSDGRPFSGIFFRVGCA